MRGSAIASSFGSFLLLPLARAPACPHAWPAWGRLPHTFGRSGHSVASVGSLASATDRVTTLTPILSGTGVARVGFGCAGRRRGTVEYARIGQTRRNAVAQRAPGLAASGGPSAPSQGGPA